MTTALTSLLEHRYVVFTGWALCMVLWESTLAAVVLAMWRLTHQRSSARAHYNASVAGFLTAVVLAAATPIGLAAIHASSRTIRAPASAGASTLALMPSTPPGPVAGIQTAAPYPAGSRFDIRADEVAGAAALLWIIGVALLAARLAGGWMLARSIVRRAQPVVAPDIMQALDALRRQEEFASGIPILQSASVDAPVVIGWRRPALILPDEAASLTSDTLAPLLAHEFAHIRRGDYLANLFQAAIELVLFFSPGVLWMSQRIREAREFCCDDAAVTECGDAKHYVKALTTLAALGAMNTARPAIGAAGPRLITRVRRLLQEEPMTAFSSVRIAALSIVTAALLVVGMRVSAASAARMPRGDGTPAAAFQDKVPYGWQTEPDGAGVKLADFVSTAEAPAQSVTVQNISSAAIVGVQFTAAVEQLPSRANPARAPVRVFSSELLPVSIPAGQSAAVSPRVLTAEQLQQVAADAGGARIQFFFGLQRVKFANGFEWSITPNPAATSGADAFNIARPVYSRDLIARDEGAAEVAYGQCRDERNRATSHGGLVPILNEPGKFMRCQNGRWVESQK